MATREIPHNEWIQFLNEYSRQHQGWIATVEVKGGNVGDHIEARSMSFRGVTYEEKGTNKGAIDIYLDKGTQSNETRTIVQPSHLRIASDGGTDKGFEVEAKDGTTTIVRFDRPASPQNVDRI